MTLRLLLLLCMRRGPNEQSGIGYYLRALGIGGSYNFLRAGPFFKIDSLNLFNTQNTFRERGISRPETEIVLICFNVPFAWSSRVKILSSLQRCIS